LGVPTTPPPVTINHPLLFAIGTAAWAVALVTVVLLTALGVADLGIWIWICAAGTFLGLVAIVYVRHSWRAK
jgi:hypothetical protein